MSKNIDKKKLLALRNKQFWTQEDLAAASGLNVRTVQRIESQGICSMETLKAIAAAFDISTDVLISGNKNKLWIIGPALGMLGGTIGSLFAYKSIFSEPNYAAQTLLNSLSMLGFISFMLAFTILFPSYAIYKYWNFEHKPWNRHSFKPH